MDCFEDVMVVVEKAIANMVSEHMVTSPQFSTTCPSHGVAACIHMYLMQESSEAAYVIMQQGDRWRG